MILKLGCILRWKRNVSLGLIVGKKQCSFRHSMLTNLTFGNSSVFLCFLFLRKNKYILLTISVVHLSYLCNLFCFLFFLFLRKQSTIDHLYGLYILPAYPLPVFVLHLIRVSLQTLKCNVILGYNTTHTFTTVHTTTQPRKMQVIY